MLSLGSIYAFPLCLYADTRVDGPPLAITIVVGTAAT